MQKTPKFPLWAALFTLLGAAILCSLGLWQLQRLEWKTDLIRQLDAEYAKPPAPLEPADLSGDFMFKRGSLRGVYEYHQEIKVGPRVYEGLPGFHVVTPLKLQDGSYVVVNRGWVPPAWPAGTESTSGEITVQGILRKPADENAFTPENRPAKNEWFHIDPAAIQDAKNLSGVSAFVLYREAKEEGPLVEYPYPLDTRPALKNDHLQYAIFWFTMAGILLVIFSLRFLKK